MPPSQQAMGRRGPSCPCSPKQQVGSPAERPGSSLGSALARCSRQHHAISLGAFVPLARSDERVKLLHAAPVTKESLANFLVPDRPSKQTKHILAGSLVGDGEHLPAGTCPARCGDVQLRALPSDGAISHDGCCNIFYFPLFKTSLPCPFSGSKEKEQFVFVLFLLKGKPSLAKRNLNQIGG